MQPSTQASNAWRVLFLLFLANLFNFFDRTIPAIIAEPIRLEWSLNDFQLGLIGTAFTIVYAIAGLPLGRMADLGSRRKIMGWGLTAWSGLTAINGLAWNFWSFLLIRMGIGIGEASYAPAANSLIGDLFPAHKRARAMGIFMLGLPLGLLLAFFTIGSMVEFFGSWRAPFFIAAVPGLVLAVFIFLIREPTRGAAEIVKVSQEPVQQPIRKVLSIRTFWWLVMAGLAFNFATYACNAFMVPLLMRYHGVSLVNASVATGVIVGLTGLIGLTLGGWVADRIHQRFARGRLMFAAVSMLIATLATGYALLAGRIDVGLFVAVFSIGWLFSYNFYTCVYTAIQDVVEPRLRATAMALFFAGLYLLGGGMGTVVVGLLSDHFAEAAMLAAGAGEMAEAFRAEGLHGAMYLIPASLLLTMVFLFQASRTFCADAKRMTAGMTAGAPGAEAVPA
ncbi:spinster family MFS transporter [Stutzerimonas stutzeri]|jgi:MFS family permease|uniref:MFS transporter n=1 Tax=Stutzerimonas stutzeri TaxID=316 RepID=A0AA40RRN8_STUST|nr:MFS transporter [Stutzerimonas stutzeri]KXO77212.1 MFS transporter [Stutzerimonas stutzeri]MBA1304775.1 MFS transporter [Stutzerimonas stutzeri]RRW11983.1 MFS transporter [Stutzerimonas stutzeri]RRW47711.1 MFS transporter [Stutzerimonas stutzeri]BCY03223.1 MFS transporter [Stutzerimonas stutzeri]